MEYKIKRTPSNKYVIVKKVKGIMINSYETVKVFNNKKEAENYLKIIL